AAPCHEDGFHARDLAERGTQEVESVHAEVAERVAAVAVVLGQRAVLPWRIGRAAEVLGADRLPDTTRGEDVEHVAHLGIGEQRVVHADGENAQRGRHRQLPALDVADREGFLDEHVAATLERLHGDLRVGPRWREDVDHVDAGVDHGREVWKDADAAQSGREVARPLRVAVGDAHQHGAREPCHGLEMDPRDRAGADEADPQRLRVLAHAAGSHGTGLSAASPIKCAPSASTRASQVSLAMAMLRRMRASGPESRSAASRATINSSTPRTIRQEASIEATSGRAVATTGSPALRYSRSFTGSM